MSSDAKPRPTLTPKEFCAEFGLSINTVMKLLAEGEIPARRLGRKWFIPRVALDAWLESAAARKE